MDVGADKYNATLYVNRDLEHGVEEFTEFETRFVQEGAEIGDDLERICALHQLGSGCRDAVRFLKTTLLESPCPENISSEIANLKREFQYAEVATALRVINKALMCPRQVWPQAKADALAHLKQLSFIKLTALPDISNSYEEARSQGQIRNVARTETVQYRASLAHFPCRPREDKKAEMLANDLIDRLIEIRQQASKRCLALVSPAGTGKTNILCSIARRIVAQSPVILLPGSLQISQDYDLEAHIERYLTASFGRSLTNWLERADADLGRERKYLFIIIDGVNENNEPSLLVRCMRTLISRISQRRVKLIVSCRDVGWEQFTGAFQTTLFSDPLRLTQFTDTEWRVVVTRYFEYFRVTARISDEARNALRNPVLLRFFCLVHKGADAGQVNLISLGSVFDSFLRQLQQVAIEQLGDIDGHACLDVLREIALEMWNSRSPSCDPEKLLTSVGDPRARSRALYLLRSEGVFQQNDPSAPRIRAKAFRFTYDAFMEFALAWAWYESGLTADQAGLDALLQQAVAVMLTFGSSGGALLYLDERLGTNGKTINRALALTHDIIDTLLASRQVLVLYLLERMDHETASASTLDMVDRFEKLAAPEVREQLARVVVRILHAQPGNERIRAVMARILETEMPTEVGVRPESSRQSKVSEHKTHALPPARHHYSEDTRLAAIALLIGSGDESDRTLAYDGIQRLGDVALHTALEGLRAVDDSADDIVCRMVSITIEASVPEYRIYCAWLLRNRYGSEPAKYIAMLQTDADRRVYEYAFSLVFDTRMIEPELVDEILRRLSGTALSPWHRANLIRILGARHRFANHERIDYAHIARAVQPFCESDHPTVRLESYRCILNFPEAVSPEAVLMKVRSDADRYVQAVAALYDERPTT